MGRIILVNESVQAYVETLLRSNTWHLGLIIGKLTNQKDYAVLMVKTPEPAEDKASDDDEEEPAPETNKKPRRKSQSKPPSLEEINDQWAATHAKQVTMMLPGGLSVIGIFAVAPPAMIQSAQAKLRQILYAIQKQEKKSAITDTSDTVGDRVLLQICSSTRKYTCRTIDVNDQKNTFRPADWKPQTGAEIWQRLETDFAINIPVYISKKSHGSNLAKQIQTGLQPYCHKLWNSLVLVNDSLRQETETLNQSAERKGKAKDKGNVGDQSTYRCNILLKQQNSVESMQPSVDECSTHLVLKGTVHGRAYIPARGTVSDACNAMRVDLIRSVLSRCQLLCDDIQMVEEDAECQEVYSTPRRVFFSLPGTNLQLCDYMFQDEKLSEVKGRVKELLDLTLEDDDLDLSFERPATEEDCAQIEDETRGGNSDTPDMKSSGQDYKYFLVAGVGGVVAFLAAGLSYMMVQDT